MEVTMKVIRRFLNRTVAYFAFNIFSLCTLSAMDALPAYNRGDATVKKVTAYVREHINPNLCHISGRAQLSNEHQAYLYNWVQGKQFTDISSQKAYTDRRDTFDNGKVSDHGSRGRLVAKWREKYGNVTWPTETIERGGQRLQAEFHAHHIIPLEFGGLNKWWNIVPLPSRIHRAVHAEVDGQLVGGGLIHISTLSCIFRANVVNN